MISYTTYDSPLQPIMLVAEDGYLTGLYMASTRYPLTIGTDWRRDDEAAPFGDAKQQLAAYFAGERTAFDLPLRMGGTAFQRQVWAELGRIPYGATISYGELARRIGSPNASRAVGLANGRNPISIVVPCHRVIGANGKLVGYAGGISRKQTLLAHEASVRARTPAAPETPAALNLLLDTPLDRPASLLSVEVADGAARGDA